MSVSIFGIVVVAFALMASTNRGQKAMLVLLLHVAVAVAVAIVVASAALFTVAFIAQFGAGRRCYRCCLHSSEWNLE